MKSLAVYCGSSAGYGAIYIQAARQVGTHLAEAGIRLVYGGGSVGLMGAVANAALDAGGEVIGVIPHFLNTRELAHTGCTELIPVSSMHERKAKMAELSEGFIALPGGFGTLDEIFEVVTWSQLALHPYPCGLLNVEGYFDSLLMFLDRMVTEKFARIEDRNRLLADSSLTNLLTTMDAWRPPSGVKWDDPCVLLAAKEALSKKC